MKVFYLYICNDDDDNIFFSFVPFSRCKFNQVSPKAVLYVDNNTISMEKREKKFLNEIYEKTYVRTTCNMHENDI